VLHMRSEMRDCPGAWRRLRDIIEGHHNNGMHPTADTTLVKLLNWAARRVMPGVMPPIA
jgi:hypothetical protein